MYILPLLIGAMDTLFGSASQNDSRKDNFRLKAQTIVVIDSCFTQAIFGQHAEKHDERQIHHMQTLHVNNENLPNEASSVIWEMYESSKATLCNIFADPTKSLETARALAEAWIIYFPKVVQTKTGIEALEW